MSTNGIVAMMIKRGSITKENYLAFLKMVNKNCPGKTILHDNATIHKAALVRDWIQDNKISVVYNPPYTPQFNPIELSFSKIKSVYRSLESHDKMVSCILKSVLSITKQDAFNFFNHAKTIITGYQN